MNTVSRGIRNAFRSGIRAGSLIVILGLVIGLSLSMLVARQAVDAKITSVKATIGNAVAISPAGFQGGEGGGEPLTNEQLAKVATVAHVTSVTRVLTDRMQTTDTNLVSAIDAGSLGQRFNRNTSGAGGTFPGAAQGQARSFTPPIAVVGTTDSTTVTQTGAVALTSGSQIAATSTDMTALVGAGLATKNNLSVGSTFTAYGQTMTVQGIIDSSANRFAGNLVVMPLATVQKLTGQGDVVTAATAKIDSIENIAGAVSTIKTTLGASADVVNQADTAATALEPLEATKTIALYNVIGSAIAASVVVLLAMVMIVRERRREIGVLKAIGASDSQVTAQFVVESITITTLASVVGVVVAALAAAPLTRILVSSSATTATSVSLGGPGGGPGGGGFRASAFGGLRNVSDVAAQVDWHLIVYGFVAALIIAAVGSAVAGWLAAHVRPSEAIRAE